MSRKRVTLTLTAVGVALFAVVSVKAWADQEPVFYVDGARPDSSVTTVQRSESELEKLCVQYSAERDDIHVCAAMPPGWQPPPKPYYDKAVCDATLKFLETANYPAVDPNSCLVIEGEELWDVVFDEADSGSNVHVPFDPTGGVEWAAHP